MRGRVQDYVPSGSNLCQGRNLTDAEANITTSGIGPRYIKARYLAFTDDTFTTLQVSVIRGEDCFRFVRTEALDARPYSFIILACFYP